jgi:hypothetical protein
VSTASADRPKCNDDTVVTLVEQLYREVTALSRAVRRPASDRRKNEQLDELADATLLLAQAPALNFAEVVAKLTVLCSRLREELHPEIRGELIDYLLAESVLEDCRTLSCGRE